MAVPWLPTAETAPVIPALPPTAALEAGGMMVSAHGPNVSAPAESCHLSARLVTWGAYWGREGLGGFKGMLE
jgi:hypothetical protein